MPDQRCHVSLDRALDSIGDGDLLLFRRWGLISKYGRGEYSHSAMAGWWDDDCFCLELREWYGGRAVSLASQVRRCPGRIDVYSPEASIRQRREAIEAMKRKCGKPYSYRAVIGAFFRHTPIARLVLSADTRDGNGGEHGAAEHCSQAVANAWRIGPRIDAVQNLADWMTEPSDLGRSPVFQYRFTIV